MTFKQTKNQFPHVPPKSGDTIGANLLATLEGKGPSTEAGAGWDFWVDDSFMNILLARGFKHVHHPNEKRTSILDMPSNHSKTSDDLEFQFLFQNFASHFF